MTRYLIIDDEHVGHAIIKGYCDLLPNMQLQKNCYDAIDALQYLQTATVDLIFLDLNMPKISGFEFLRTLPHPPQVIVTTAYQEHALEGYELNIVDYLLKPFGFNRFLKAVNKALHTPRNTNTPDRPNGTKRAGIFLQSNKQYIRIDLDAILYLEASGNYTKIVTTTEILTIREKISALLHTLSDDDLVQVHKSFAVAKQHINRIEGNRIFVGDQVIPIGKTYRLSFLKNLG